MTGFGPQPPPFTFSSLGLLQPGGTSPVELGAAFVMPPAQGWAGIDDTATLSAAAAAANAAGGGFVALPGSFQVNGAVPGYDNVAWVVTPSTNVTGSGSIAGDPNALALQGRGPGFFRPLLSNHTEHSLFVGATMPVSGATANYEKDVLYISGIAYDPSGAFQLDQVALHAQMTIGTGNTAARAWAADFQTIIPAGTDGFAVGLEINVQNNGSSQPLFNTTTSKIGLHVDSDGTNEVTAAVLLDSSNGGLFYNGYAGFTTALDPAGDFINLYTSPSNSPFEVKSNGIIVEKGTAFPTIGTGQLFIGGLASQIAMVSGSGLVYLSTTNGLIFQGRGFTNDFQMRGGTGTAVFNIPSGTANVVFNGSISYQVATVTKTADYAVTAADSGKSFDNIGATGSVTFSLPAAAAGLKFAFTNYAGQSMEILANGTDQIAIGASESTSENITSTAAFASITIESHGAGGWVATATPDKTQWTVH